MPSFKSDIVDLEMILIYRKGTSVLFESMFDDKKTWLPMSQIEIDPPDASPTDRVTVSMPEWIAKDRKLI
jgi:hypothetical protein